MRLAVTSKGTNVKCRTSILLKMSKWWVSYIYLLFRVQAMSTYMYGLKRYAVYIISLILIIAINGHLWMAEAWIEHKSRRSTNNLNGHW